MCAFSSNVVHFYSSVNLAQFFHIGELNTKWVLIIKFCCIWSRERIIPHKQGYIPHKQGYTPLQAGLHPPQAGWHPPQAGIHFLELTEHPPQGVVSIQSSTTNCSQCSRPTYLFLHRYGEFITERVPFQQVVKYMLISVQNQYHL